MKDVPDIAPEIRGLLEEIVADPRSMIRLAPRRALRSWFDTGEMVRASDVTRTKAERHLVEVHREELAALLCEASWISYWKAPVLTYRPIDAEGRLFHPTEREPEWRRRAAQETELTEESTGIQLLGQCLVGIEARQGSALAKASLSLVPSDNTRRHVALNAQWSNPRQAIILFGRIANRTQPAKLRPKILVSLAAQMCHLGLLAQARQIYRASGKLDSRSCYSWGSAFNLSCFLGDDRGARDDASELGKAVSLGDPSLLELRALLQGWRAIRAQTELERARTVVERIKDGIPEVARGLC